MQAEQPHDPALHGSPQAGDVSRAVAWYGVGVLSVVQLFSFIDRQALSLLIGPIKAEFGMSDTQVSLVIGLGFAIAYAIAGLPIGRLVDQWFRPALLGLGLTLWSVCTATCGFAQSFGQLALLRSGVGIGLSLGPTLFAVLTDKVFGNPALLWRSLAFAAPSIAVLAAVLSLFGLRPYRNCVAANQHEQASIVIGGHP